MSTPHPSTSRQASNLLISAYESKPATAYGCLKPAGRIGAGAGMTVMLILLVTLGAFECTAQVNLRGKLVDFKLPDYYPATSPSQTNRALKTLLKGKEAQQHPSGKVQISGLAIESFGEDGRKEVEVNAPECMLDLNTREASGPGHLQVLSSSGLFSIEGEGFLWRQSDGLLILSNRAVTTLRRDLLSKRSMEGLEAGKLPAGTPPATGQVVRITSDHCLFNNLSNLVRQSGNVVVDDPQIQIRCETLQAQFTTNRALQDIQAIDNVSILNKADGSMARADRAVYAINGAAESIALTGKPAWRDRDGRQEVNAGRFLIDVKERRIRCDGDAVLRLPRGSVSQNALMLDSAPRKAQAAATDNTNLVQISASVLTLTLGTTNKPQRVAIAESNVVILSPSDATRATGNKLTYREDLGFIELAGQAQWAAEGRVVQGEVLTMDRTNRIFRGQGQTLFRLPLQQTGRAGTFRGSTNRVSATNLFLEVRADEFLYQTNTLDFKGGKVVTRVLEGDSLRGGVTSGTLTARFSDRLESILAEKRVVAENYPPPGAQGKVTTNSLCCETLAARFSASGQVIAVVASENVQAAQIEVRTKPDRVVVSELTCDILTAVVLPKAGRVDKLKAERHVVISQGDKLARAEEAEYTDKEDRLVLSGQPYAEFSEGRIRDARTLTWDRATGAFKGRGQYRIEWNKPAGSTNQFRIRMPKL